MAGERLDGDKADSGGLGHLAAGQKKNVVAWAVADLGLVGGQVHKRLLVKIQQNVQQKQNRHTYLR